MVKWELKVDYFLAGKIGFYDELRLIGKKQLKIGQDSHWDDRICTPEQWDLDKIFMGSKIGVGLHSSDWKVISYIPKQLNGFVAVTY